jgi:antirestriction protein ArdC
MPTVYEIVTERIIQALDGGVAPWRKPWRRSLSGVAGPTNLPTGRAYRGLNLLLLGSAPYASPYWLTFRQAQALGGSVRKGEKATPVLFWKLLPRREESEKEIPFLRYYSVFNLEQCDGLEAPDAVPAPSVTPIEAAEAILANLPHPRPQIHHGHGSALYWPGRDAIALPDPGAFSPLEEYYWTLLHELAHNAARGINAHATERSTCEGEPSKLSPSCDILMRVVSHRLVPQPFVGILWKLVTLRRTSGALVLSGAWR